MGLFVRSAALAAMMMGSQAFAQSGSLDLVGTWLTQDGRAKIRTDHCGDGNQRLCGVVVWIKDPLNDKGQPRTDFKNPDPAKRSRPSLGLEIMSNLKPEDATHFAGEIYNADDGKMYAVTLGMESAGELQIRGCMLHFLCGSQTWARVADIAPPAPTKVSATSGAKPAKPAAPAGGAHLHDNQPTQQ